MEIDELKTLKEQIESKLCELKRNKTKTNDILLTEKTLSFILELVEEKIKSKRASDSLLMTQDEYDKILGG